MQDISILIPSNRPIMAAETQKALKDSDYNSIIHDGSNYPSFSKLVNDCILRAESEIVFIVSDKVEPNANYVKKTLFLLNKGFGFVALCKFYFFAFTKNLIRTIGFFDERFIGGGFEDSDFGKRLLEHDIAAYISVEIPYADLPSSWKYNNPNSEAAIFYRKKWNTTDTSWTRLLPDEEYNYRIGSIIGNPKWMEFKYSILLRSSVVGHKSLKYFNGKPVDFSNMQVSELI